MAFLACEGAISVGSCNICGDEPVFALLKFDFFFLKKKKFAFRVKVDGK